ncbi:hypothetical protein [Tardiphaga sp.]|jgi:hypothetical protein|uniref:hypothetical protein n=1 Tax=Tardiphaga sp. TaxID=1926292 RepID=UPI0037DA6042
MTLTKMIKDCPVCGRQPDIDKCGPWPKGLGPAPWYAGCYRGGKDEHFVGVNGDNRSDAVRAWNAEVECRSVALFGDDRHG